MLKIMQKGFNYSQDGPGNRLVYHLQGCNMRCPWCANPEGLSVQGTLLHVKDANSGRVKEKSGCRLSGTVNHGAGQWKYHQ